LKTKTASSLKLNQTYITKKRIQQKETAKFQANQRSVTPMPIGRNFDLDAEYPIQLSLLEKTISLEDN